MQDSIVREITVQASQEKVYSAITDPKKITQWFPDSVEGDIKEGEQPIFIFENGTHKAKIFIEKATPFSCFSYRWVPGGNNSNTEDVRTKANTLVEFMIEDLGEKTKVTVKESGFASLPAEVAEQSFKDNSGGWGYMMDRLQKLFA